MRKSFELNREHLDPLQRQMSYDSNSIILLYKYPKHGMICIIECDHFFLTSSTLQNVFIQINLKWICNVDLCFIYMYSHIVPSTSR
jgi:hypothetical protein